MECASVYANIYFFVGAKVAAYAGQKLADKLLNESDFKRSDYPNALIKAFLNLDEEIRKGLCTNHHCYNVCSNLWQWPIQQSHPVAELRECNCGATAVTCLVTADRLICANAGDSRCVIGQQGKAIPLSFDHKPNSASEFERIRNAGGFVELNRVNGALFYTNNVYAASI